MEIHACGPHKQHNTTMKRDDWTFRYTAKQLAEAATLKVEYHKARLEFWSNRREQLVNEIRESGIEVNEKAAVTMPHAKVRDFQQGGNVMIRNDLSKALSETYDKLGYHTGRRDTYDGWQQSLLANPDNGFELDIDDWLFFFGKDVSTRDN